MPNENWDAQLLRIKIHTSVTSVLFLSLSFVKKPKHTNYNE